jgi:hypothetical protein
MAALVAGQTITVAKWNPEGADVARYEAQVVTSAAPGPWLEVLATWTMPAVNVAGLRFEPGDAIREFFSPLHPFNAFAVLTPGGDLRGIYGNVTFPAFLMGEDAGDVLVWHDLYLDAVVLPDETVRLLDDDELAASGLPESRPLFAAAIVRAREEMLAMLPWLLA